MNLRPGFLCLFLVFISLGIYYPTLFAPYNSLDDQLLVQQLLNQERFSFARHFAPGGTYDYYRPLVTMTFEIDKYVGGLQESFMHLVNMLLHTLNVVLVFLVARRFAVAVGREGNLLPFLSAVLFCLHPINTEAVNWIAARTDLLAGTFVFSSLLFMLMALERHSLVLGGVGAFLLFGGALCKETALFLFPGIFLLLFWRTKSVRPAWPWRWVLPGLCASAIAGYFFLRWGAYATDRGLSNTTKLVVQLATTSPKAYSVSSGSHLLLLLDAARVALKVSGYYATKLIQPLPLNFAIVQVGAWYLLPGVALAFLIPTLVIRRRPVGVFLLLSILLGSSALLVAFTRLAWTPIAERYMYVPCGLFVVAVMFGLADLVERLGWQKYCLAAIPLLMGTCAWATVNRNIVWQDNLTLYQDAVRKSPDFGFARNELALALYAHNRPKEASSLITSARMNGGQRASLNQFAVLVEKGRFGEARTFLRQRLADPGPNEIYILERLVKVTFDQADKSTDQMEKRVLYQETVAWLARLEHLTNDPFHWYQLGRVNLILKNRQEAQRCFSEAARRLPDDSIYKSPATKLARNLAS